jgi:nicotinamide mononucleotide transporter
MDEVLTALVEGLRGMSLWEAAAVLLAVTYLLLAIRQNVLCWPAAIASASIYLVLMFQAGLYMQSGLQLFYMAMAAYGWWYWQLAEHGGQLPVSSWVPREHVVPIAAILALGAATGVMLYSYSDAAFPFLDSWVAWGAIVTTWMVANKVLQNWYYWFVIDTVSIYLYASQGLWLTAILFLVYLVLIVVGYRRWRASMADA